jgi:hypothetical protein
VVLSALRCRREIGAAGRRRGRERVRRVLGGDPRSGARRARQNARVGWRGIRPGRLRFKRNQQEPYDSVPDPTAPIADFHQNIGESASTPSTCRLRSRSQMPCRA